MFFDMINIYHNLVQNTVKMVLLNITETEFSILNFLGDLEAVPRGLCWKLLNKWPKVKVNCLFLQIVPAT